MDYKIVDYYLDCPYKAFLALSNKAGEYNLETIFKFASEKSIQVFLSDKENLTHKIKLNKSVSVFEKYLKINKITGTTFDLLMRKFIHNMKLMFDSINYEVLQTVPSYVVKLEIPNMESIDMLVLGYHRLKKNNKESYRFFLYESNIKYERIDNFLRVKLLIYALQKDPAINQSALKYSVISLFDFYHVETRNININKVHDITSVAHLESILAGINLGLAHPSPKPYHCNTCEFKKQCVYTCDPKAELNLNDESDLVKRKFKKIIDEY